MPEQSARQQARRRRPTKPSLAPLGRLHRYSITGLFDTFTYDFDLDTQGPTLLTGVNGTGKSTILRTIDAVSTGSWLTLAELPFRSMTLEFDSERSLKIERLNGGMQVSLTGEESWEFTGARDNIDIMHLRDLEAELEYLRNAETDVYSADSRSEARELSRRQAILVERRYEIERRIRAGRHPRFPEWSARLGEIFPVLFITDQRLIIDSPNRERSTRAAADEVARQIAREISSAKSSYGSRSQDLDHDFPQRAIRTIKDPPKLTEQELRDQLDELTRRSAALEAVGLLAKESVSEFEDLDLALENVQPVIQTYITDSQQKLAVLEPLRLKLQLFSEFLRQHYGHKRIVIDPDGGFTISTGTKKKEDPLPPRKLSSGEQQMMVLAHQILFKATPGTLVLIDEPELSLHVLWQATFVEDLAEMGRVNNLSFLLATHSPTLIGGREDLKRSLDKMNDQAG
jgi:ABC-type transport system involved in cytochrome c biogenesis ATPase subunit